MARFACAVRVGSSHLWGRRTLSRVQRGETFLSRTGVVGRLIAFSAVGGVLAAALVVPVVAATGVLVRNTANKFTTLSLLASGLPQRSQILDRYGHLLAYVYGVDMPYYIDSSHASAVQVDGLNRQPVSYNQISQNMVNAIVGIEDDRYWQHGAIDLKGTVRAAVNDLQHKAVQGGSTLAQQYVKNVLILQAVQAGNKTAIQQAQADTLNRKLNELRMAVAIEHNYSKQDIVAGYLNDAYFGHNAYGVEAAAETYFGTTSAKLTVTQAATLAGIVENPSKYDPIIDPSLALERRNTVLDRMAATDNGLTKDQAATAKKAPLGLNVAPVQSGCEANTVGSGAGFFCQYVEEVFLHDPAYGATPQARAKLLATGGLQVYTTLDPKDQAAANNAVNYVVPYNNRSFNPGNNAATEAVIQPGTGEIRAIAEDRPYGTNRAQTEINYAVNTAYGGGGGVQTGSSSKLFTLVTALEQGIPFGFTKTVPGTEDINGYTDCHGDGTSDFKVTNAEGNGTTTDSLYTGTTNSINVFYAELEKQVGLCNVVRTAAKLGMTRVDGTSLFSWDSNDGKRCPRASTAQTEEHCLPPADSLPTFTLGTVNVSPLSMAAAYATMAARGEYCSPIAIDKIITDTGASLAVPSAGCHRAISADVADAANYILQGVLTSGTAAGMELAGREAAGKTGTSNDASGFGSPYAAFAGYTPTLVGYVSVAYMDHPFETAPHFHLMSGSNAYYRLEDGSLGQPGEMFGANAPASTWHMTFDHANLGASASFVPVPGDSPFNSQGDGQTVKQPPKKKKGNGGGGNGGGNGGGGNGGGGNGGGGNGGGGGGNGGGGGGNGGGPGGFGGNNAMPVTLPTAHKTATAKRRK
jgi:membrane peptidoglycan carboxypeptidase